MKYYKKEGKFKIKVIKNGDNSAGLSEEGWVEVDNHGKPLSSKSKKEPKGEKRDVRESNSGKKQEQHSS